MIFMLERQKQMHHDFGDHHNGVFQLEMGVNCRGIQEDVKPRLVGSGQHRFHEVQEQAVQIQIVLLPFQ